MGRKGSVGRARPLRQADFGHGPWGQEKESRLELQDSRRQAVVKGRMGGGENGDL